MPDDQQSELTEGTDTFYPYPNKLFVCLIYNLFNVGVIIYKVYNI